jgi:hypothetical protein
MTPRRSADEPQEPAQGETTEGPTSADLGQDEGYIGQKVDPRPNEDYSLEGGPDSPSAAEVNADVAQQRAEDQEAQAGNEEPAKE